MRLLRRLDGIGVGVSWLDLGSASDNAFIEKVKGDLYRNG